MQSRIEVVRDGAERKRINLTHLPLINHRRHIDRYDACTRKLTLLVKSKVQVQDFLLPSRCTPGVVEARDPGKLLID